jgi:hypothetical protein
MPNVHRAVARGARRSALARIFAASSYLQNASLREIAIELVVQALDLVPREQRAEIVAAAERELDEEVERLYRLGILIALDTLDAAVEGRTSDAGERRVDFLTVSQELERRARELAAVSEE